MPDIHFLHSSPFYEVTALLFFAAAIGYIGLLLRQPMIVSYILIGVLAGPSVLGIIQSHDKINLLAELGVTLLLFLVGLKLDIKLIKTLGIVSLTAGLGQILFTSIIVFLIGLLIGLDTINSFFVAVALTFSSTIIVIKMLTDKREVDSLHGRISIGILIVQDLMVIISMMILSAFGIKEEAVSSTIGNPFAHTVIYGMILLILTGIFIRYLANPLINHIAHSPELLIIFAIAWATLLATLSSHFGFSRELGGLLAGVSLASTPFREAIVARLSAFRDFLLLFFFVALGAQFDLNQININILSAVIFSLFVLIGKPLIVIAIMGVMGYRKRTSFFTGLTLAQISEFSLIFMSMGWKLGYVTAESLALVTLVGLITIAISAYMITYSHPLYRWLEDVLDLFERKIPYREETEEQRLAETRNYDVILFGLGRYGSAIERCLRKENFRLLLIDFNPDIIRRFRHHGYDVIYGDISDQDLIENLPLNGVKWVISAIPQHDLGVTYEDSRIVLINSLKERGFFGKIAVTTQHAHEVDEFKIKGADLVLLPFEDAAERAVKQIKESS